MIAVVAIIHRNLTPDSKESNLDMEIPKSKGRMVSNLKSPLSDQKKSLIMGFDKEDACSDLSVNSKQNSDSLDENKNGIFKIMANTRKSPRISSILKKRTSISSSSNSEKDLMSSTQKEQNDDRLQLVFENSKQNNESKILNPYNSCEKVKESRLQSETKSNSSSVTISKQSSEYKRADLEHGNGISPKLFYSNVKNFSLKNKDNQSFEKLKPQDTSPKTKRNHNKIRSFFNKGVHHKIKRKPHCKFPGTDDHTLITTILNSLRNEKLRDRLLLKRQEREQIEEVHSIFRNKENPIDMAKPLSALNNTGETSKETDNNSEFSGTDSDSEVENKTLIESRKITSDDNEITPKPATNKFFKSGHSISSKKEFQINEKMKVSVLNGKYTIVREKKRPKSKTKRKNSGKYH